MMSRWTQIGANESCLQRFVTLARRIYKGKRLFNLHQLHLARRFVRKRGLFPLVQQAYGKCFPEKAYAYWISKNEADAAELERQRRTRFTFTPLISLVVPVFNTPPQFLLAMLQSICAQTFGNWELCLADASRDKPEVRRILGQFLRQDSRIRATFLETNLGIAGNSNAALRLASGEYVALVDHDDTLAPFALFEIAQALQRWPDADFLYSDEDKISEDGRVRKEHHFKPDWAPDTLRSQNYITHLTTLSRSLLARVGGFRPGFDGSQDYDLILRATEQARRIVHIPKVLYHWRCHAQSVAQDGAAKMYAYDAGRKALSEHLTRIGMPGVITNGHILGTYHVSYIWQHQPKVSMLILPRRAALARSTHPKSFARMTYRNVEIIRANSGELSPSSRLPGPAAKIKAMDDYQIANEGEMLNAAARNATGEFLLFFDPALVPANPDWLDRMIEYFIRQEVGAVGGKICHRNGTVEHAGTMIGVGDGIGYSHRHFHGSAPGYGCRLVTTQNVSAVSGACLLTRKKLFLELGGFDGRFHSAYYDFDFCLRIREKGGLIVWTPRAVLRRTSSNWRRKLMNKSDQRRFRNKWCSTLGVSDPYYNPNFTRDWEDFTLCA